MADHQRKVIRKAVIQALTGVTRAADRVSSARVDDYQKSELPAISVFMSGELVDSDSRTSTLELTRELTVDIVGAVAVGPTEQLDDVLDDFAAEIEAVLDDDPYIGGTAVDSVIASTDHTVKLGGDKPIGYVALTYTVTYRSKPIPLELDKFAVAGTTTRIVGAVDGNAARDEIDPSSSGTGGGGTGGGLANVTRDAGNGNYYPANASEWSLLLAAAGLAGVPSSTWNLQEPSGNLADAIGGITLTPVNWSLWRQLVPGAARFCMRGTDNTANAKLMNSSTAPNPALTSTLLLMYLDLPVAPAATRFVAVTGQGCDLRLNNAGKLVLQTTAATAFPTAAGAGPRWVVLACNNTARTTKAYTDQEKVVGTYAQPTSAPFIALGSNNGPVGAIGYAYAAQFTGAAAELSDVQVKRLLQTLGATVLW